MPAEIEIAANIERYGAWSVYGRPMSAGEIRRINCAKAIGSIYTSLHQSENWTAWVNEHQAWSEMLNEAAELANGR